MTMNDLTAPLGQDPNKTQRAVAIPAAKIIAVALGLFFAAFVLWAIIAEDRFGGQPIAVAPADLQHIAKKAPAVIAVPQAAAPVDAAQATTTATLPPATAAPQPAGPAKPPGTVTITIVDGKTGATRQVVVAAPQQPESGDTTGQLPPGPPARKR